MMKPLYIRYIAAIDGRFQYIQYLYSMESKNEADDVIT